MKTIKLLAIALLLSLSALVNAQTLTRSVVLKPAGSATTATIDLLGNPAASWSLDFPDGSLAANGPFMKVSVASGNKAVSFGQVSLTSNGAAGDITGTLGVSNGGTGLATLAAGSLLIGNGASAMNTLAAGTNGQVLSMVGGTPAWTNSIGSTNATRTTIGGGTSDTVAIGTGTGGNITIGNATSTTNLNGTVTFGTAPSIPLPLNNIWVGNASNVQAAVAPTANAVLITSGTGNLVPTWTTSLPIAQEILLWLASPIAV